MAAQEAAEVSVHPDRHVFVLPRDEAELPESSASIGPRNDGLSVLATSLPWNWEAEPAAGALK